MSKFLSAELTGDLYARLAGDHLEACADKVIPICTVDGQGWPHPALLSYFEVVAKDRRNIRLATYKDSSSTNNMRRNGKLTLLIFDQRTVFYIKGKVAELRPEMKCMPHNSKLNLAVEQVLSDHADEQFEPGAYISAGVTYYNPNRAKEQEQARALLEELREE